MNKVHLLAAVAGLMLVSASPPTTASRAGPSAATGDYPACSATVTDRCIQLHERGVRNARQPRDMSHAGHPRAAAPAHRMAGSTTSYPPCSATVTDRCTQGGRREVSHRYATQRRSSRGESMRLAYRAGERG